MAEQTQSVVAKKALGYLRTGGKKLTLSLGSKAVRAALIFMALAVCGYLLFRTVMNPLSQSVLLPSGVSQRNPELEGSLLQVINNERVERSQYQTRSFAAFEPLFAVSPTPSPTPLTP